VEQLEDRTLLSGTPQLLADINPGAGNSFPLQMVVIGSTTYFWADDGTHGNEVWKTDGTTAGTSMVTNINNPYRLTNVNGELFFTADDGTHGTELWKSDGTTAGTSMVKDIYPGSSYPNSSNPRELTNVNGTLYFTANDGHGYELWKSAGTTAGTVMVADINPNNINPGSGGPDHLTNVNGELFFEANDGIHGYELWKSDGTVAGTILVKDIYPGSRWVNGYYGNYYVVNSSSPSNLTNVNGELFFTADDGTHGTELWKSDGTTAGTSMVKDIYPGYFGGSVYPNSSNPRQLTNVNGTLYFAANDGTHGTELWKSDGTAAGTTLVSDINPGNGASYPQNLTNVNGELFFTANDGTTGAELWKSDGTAGGTTMVEDINPGTTTTWYYTGAYGTFTNTVTTTGSNPLNLTNVNGTLYFTANDGTHGYELWKSDGTTAGTTMLADIKPGSSTHSYTSYSETRSATLPNSSFPSNLTNLNGTLLFSADDGVHGTELWMLPDASTSPPSPTVRVNDVTVTEGNTGRRAATFTVTLSTASTKPVTVTYATSNGTATAGSDYTAISGTLTIPAGQTTGTITVLVKGDRLGEATETFFVNLSSPTNATIADGQGVGTIVDDEPRISISDVSKKEGKKGQTTSFTFTVTLSAAYDQAVTMSFRTTDGTAKTSDIDYVGKIGKLTFAPGETTKTITIVVNGDRKKESDETFYLDLFGLSSNALYTRNRGTGTILNRLPACHEHR
jgi:ELWxxDGT repeat protein